MSLERLREKQHIERRKKANERAARLRGRKGRSDVTSPRRRPSTGRRTDKANGSGCDGRRKWRTLRSTGYFAGRQALTEAQIPSLQWPHPNEAELSDTGTGIDGAQLTRAQRRQEFIDFMSIIASSADVTVESKQNTLRTRSIILSSENATAMPESKAFSTTKSPSRYGYRLVE